MALAVDTVFTAHGGTLVTSYGPRHREETVGDEWGEQTWIGCDPKEAEVWSVFTQEETGPSSWVADVDSEAHARMLARCLILSCGFCINEEC